MKLARSDSPESPFSRIRCSVCGQPPASIEVVPVLFRVHHRGRPHYISSREIMARVTCCNHSLFLSSVAGEVSQDYFERKKRA